VKFDGRLVGRQYLGNNNNNNMALTSPKSGGRSVGIVRWRTTATEFSLIIIILVYLCAQLNNNNNNLLTKAQACH
jgi:hypothetical protein